MIDNADDTSSKDLKQSNFEGARGNGGLIFAILTERTACRAAARVSRSAILWFEVENEFYQRHAPA